MKKMKKMLVPVAVLCASALGGAMLLGNATNEATKTFEMVGASIRYAAEGNNIRFAVNMDENTYVQLQSNENAAAGTLIIPSDMLSEGATLAIDTENAINAVTYSNYGDIAENKTAWEKDGESGLMQSIVYLTDVPSLSYNRELTAVGYIDWGADATETRYEYTSVKKCAIADIALAAIADESENKPTAEQKTQLRGYINQYTVQFAGLFGEIESQKVDYGSEFAAPENPETRAGYNFLGWFEKNVEGALNEKAVDFDAVDKTVKSRREFTAKFEKIFDADTFEKCDLDKSGWVAGGGGYFEYSGGKVNVKTTYLMKDAEVPQYTNFALYATIAPTSQQVGFVLSGGELTGENPGKQYLQFVYRPADKDVYLWSDSQTFTGGKGMWLSLPVGDIKPFGENNDQNLEMALVYGNGVYYIFMNGTMVKSVSISESQYGVSVAQAMGTTGNVKLGLASRDDKTTFVNWGYSTNTAVLAKYGISDTHEKPESGSIIHSNPNSSSATYADNGNLLLTGTYLFKNGNVRQGADFALYATIAPGAATQQVGFVLSGSSDGSYLQFVYRRQKNDIYLWSETGKVWGEGDFLHLTMPTGEKAPFGSDGTQNMEIALIYKTGVYYIFVNGEKVLERAETANSNSWGAPTLRNAIGTGNPYVRLGLASPDNTSTFVDWGFTVSAEKIAEYFV